MTSEELLQRKIDRQKRQIELLEKMIEDRSRDIFTINEELSATNGALTKSLDELRTTQRELVDASRRAGMADVATSVLHNVGNVMNSVNVSAACLQELLRNSKASGIGKAVALLRAQPDPGRFLTEDPRGRKLLDYLDGVVEAMTVDRGKASDELKSIEKNLEHIRTVVTRQQTTARGSVAIERVSARATILDALDMAAGSIERQQIETICELDGLGEADSISIDRHKLFQILVNLFANAAHALKPRSSDRRIRVSAQTIADDRIAIRVVDNGVGIPAENLSKIFAHGFTTRAGGHGFGLHSCANAATEMGGRLEATSEGPGLGATFTLVVPRTARTPTMSLVPTAGASPKAASS